MIIISSVSYAQLPIAYYDFESSNHSTFANLVDMEVNAGTSSTIANNGGTFTNGSGAGGKYISFNSGKAMQVYLGSTSSGTDPKTAATHYQQFKVSTSGFSGIAVQFDVLAGNNSAEYYGISYSTNGTNWTWVASVTTEGSNDCPWSYEDWSTATVNIPAAGNNAANLYIRIYEYRSNSTSSSANLRFDNLQVTATSTVAGAGTKNMLDEFELLAAHRSSSVTPYLFSRNKFTVDGAGTTVNMNTFYFTGIFGGAGGNLTVSNNATLNLNSDTYSHYIDKAGFFIPVSTINILSGGTLNMNNTLDCDGNIVLTNGTLKVNGQTLMIGGNVSRTNGLINATAGTVEFTGSNTQTIAGSYFTGKTVYNFKNSNSTAVTIASTLNDTLRVTGTVSFGSVDNSVINTGNNLTLVSSASGTAGVADITNNAANSGNSISGNVTVEKYIATGKKWNFVCFPTNTTQTFRQTLQENNAPGANVKPGYGMNVYNNGSWSANGFDAASGSPTVKTFDAATGGYTGITSTSSVVNNSVPYMIYTRGDRSITLASVTTSATTLRTTGSLKQNAQTAINVAATKFVAISNPYAAAVDMRKITKAGVQDFFYVWDPKLGGAYGLGAFQLFSKEGSDYVVTPGGGSYAEAGSVNNFIKSGQGFFVKGGASAGTVTFKENAKASGANVISAGRVFPTQSLRANLYVVSTDTVMTADGILANFGDNYSNAIDEDDAIKVANGSENLSIKSNGTLLSVERHKSITATDTLFLNLTGVRVQNYRMDIILSNLNLVGLTAYFVDKYLNTRTSINVKEITSINFSVANIPASYAADRFMIVFKSAKVLPVISSTEISAARTIANTTTITNEVVAKTTTGINVYPNPVVNKTMNIQFSNQPAGDYNLTLINQSGQAVYRSTISINAKNATKAISLNAAVSAGNYEMVVTAADGAKSVQQIIIL